jgi:hypothetical protein
MRTCVIIPYRPQADHSALAWTLEGFKKQQLSAGHTLDVHVGLDGPTSRTDLPHVGASPWPVTFHEFPWMGAAAVRQALVKEVGSASDLLIFTNADTRPESDLVQQHVATMAKLPSQSLVLGAAPWERLAPTVLDTLVDTTPMIFSYCHAEPRHWYPFRIAYSLNLSVRYADYVACGGFHDQIRPYYYEDLAFGCRLLGPQRQGLFYEPDARVVHRHPMTFEQYLDREELLGVMAPVLARVCPEAFQVLMAGRAADQIARDFQTKLQGDTTVYRRLYHRLREKLALPAETLGRGQTRLRSIETLYQLHIPVKLLAFRLGFLRGMELADDGCWQQRKPAGLWRALVA